MQPKAAHNSVLDLFANNKHFKGFKLLGKDGHWYSNYLLFNLEIWGLGTLLCMVLPTLPPLAVMMFTGAVVGAFIQGYSKCPAQIAIENQPVLAGLTGAVNGLMCCGSLTLLELGVNLGCAAAFGASAGVWATSAALLLNTALMSFAMCKVESSIVLTFCNDETKAIYERELRKPEGAEKSCCKSKRSKFTCNIL